MIICTPGQTFVLKVNLEQTNSESCKPYCSYLLYQTQGWARSDFFEIVSFRSRTVGFSLIVPFSFLFFYRSVLVPFRPVPFRSEQKNGLPIPSRSQRSYLKNGSIPLVPFLVKERFHSPVPFLAFLFKERYHPKKRGCTICRLLKNI